MVKIKNTRRSSPEPDEETGVMHLGKGKYQLSDGSVVKGKKKAIEAESKLGQSEPDAE